MPALSIPCREAACLSGGRHGRTPTRKAVAPVRALTRKTKTVTTAKTAD